jgi:hypothetical protein
MPFLSLLCACNTFFFFLLLLNATLYHLQHTPLFPWVIFVIAWWGGVSWAAERGLQRSGMVVERYLLVGWMTFSSLVVGHCGVQPWEAVTTRTGFLIELESIKYPAWLEIACWMRSSSSSSLGKFLASWARTRISELGLFRSHPKWANSEIWKLDLARLDYSPE